MENHLEFYSNTRSRKKKQERPPLIWGQLGWTQNKNWAQTWKGAKKLGVGTRGESQSLEKHGRPTGGREASGRFILKRKVKK